jgi:hypothetical protein
VPDLFLELKYSDESDGVDIEPLTEDETIALLQDAEFTGSKLIPWGSNYSFAVALEDASGREQLAIYKPQGGENPLYDFPDGTLYQREVAAYRLSRLLNWPIVPPTVVRDGPMGLGSLQLYVAPAESREREDPRRFWGQPILEIERLVLFDHISNNADRKLSHCLLDQNGSVWGIDHGLCFNVQSKLRTVLWQFVGMPVSPELMIDLARVRADEVALVEALDELLEDCELDALLGRMDVFLRDPCYPALDPYRNVPYGWW